MSRDAHQDGRRHLLLVTHHYAPELGAPQRRWDALTPRLIEAGVDVTVLAPPPHYPSGRLTDARPEYAPGRISRGEHGERIIRTRFREHTARLRSRAVDQAVVACSSVVLGLRILRGVDRRPDLVVGTVPGIPSMFAAWVLARALGARYVVEMRDAWPDLIEPAGVLRGGRSLRPRLLRGVRVLVHRAVSRLQRRADAVVTTTETFGRVLAARGIRRVTVIRNGTSASPVTPAEPAPGPGHGIRRALRRPVPDRPLHSRPLRATYAGTVGRAQDLDTVVRAAAELLRRGHRVEVQIAGSGAESARLEALVSELGAPVRLLGPLPPERVRELYAWADTVVVSLRDWAPLEWTVPSKLYEVMASGRFATACVAGEAGEIVAETRAGAVVPPGDVSALVDLWAGWVTAGAAPRAAPDAVEWVEDNANDDVLAAQLVDLVETLAPTRFAATLVPARVLPRMREATG